MSIPSLCFHLVLILRKFVSEVNIDTTPFAIRGHLPGSRPDHTFSFQRTTATKKQVGTQLDRMFKSGNGIGKVATSLRVSIWILKQSEDKQWWKYLLQFSMMSHVKSVP